MTRRPDAPRNACSYDYDNRTETHVSFDGLVDAKGRTLGARVRLTPVTVTAGFEPPGRCTTEPVGTYVAVYVHVTRDGSTFGALHRDYWESTPAAAQRKADELVAAARARYAKRAAAGAKL
jgi:hypothetical protein